MIELAEQVGMIEDLRSATIPTGVIVGSAVIAKVEQLQITSDKEHVTQFQWHLAGVERVKKLRTPQAQGASAAGLAVLAGTRIHQTGPTCGRLAAMRVKRAWLAENKNGTELPPIHTRLFDWRW
jgi:hypothetical protein